MTATLAQIVRHPVKSAGYEELPAVTLIEGQALPFDRHWAIATEGARFDGAPQGWEPKMNFLRGAAEGTLQAIRARFDPESRRIVLSHPDRPDFTGHLPADGAALVNWLRPLWPASRPPLRALVARGDAGALTDVPEPWIAVLNRASLRALGQRMGRDLSIHRFRGNLWLDDLPPWAEFDWIGRQIRIGAVRLQITEPITRCVATCFDPATGAEGGDTLSALESGWGHRDFGVYARVLTGGPVALGDPVEEI